MIPKNKKLIHITIYVLTTMVRGVHQTTQTAQLHLNRPQNEVTTPQVVMKRTAPHCVVQSVVFLSIQINNLILYEVSD